MSSRSKKRIKKDLKNPILKAALERATQHHFHKFLKNIKDFPWEEYKDKARAIREDCLKRLPELIEQFTKEAAESGLEITRVRTSQEAQEAIERILTRHRAHLVVKAKSMVSEEIGLNRFLEKKGFEVVETDLGEWIVQLAGERPSHLTAPALHKTKEEIAELLSRKLNRTVPPDPVKITRLAREHLRETFIKADAGISGANLAIAESGTLVILSNEGNARLVTSLPPVHIALITVEKFVETLEQASVLIKVLARASSGAKLTSYVSFISGPSRTTDIEKETVIGVHGPQSVYVIILDNGRLALSDDPDFKESLYCLKCGGCLLACPVFQLVGGYNFGGPVYPGGIGLILTAITRSFPEAAPFLELCADCKKCEDYCPVRIRTGQILLKLKSFKGPDWLEKTASSFFSASRVSDRILSFLSLAQNLWEKGEFLKTLATPWTSDKSIPVIKRGKFKSRGENRRGKIYLFHGCLINFFFPEVAESASRVLAELDFEAIIPESQNCCGAPSLHAGDEKSFQKLAFRNLSSFESEKPDYILTLCPTGQGIISRNYPKVDPRFKTWASRTFLFSDFLASKNLLPRLIETPQAGTVYYHYSCHLLNELKLKDLPEKILKSLGYEKKDEGEPYACCGFCGLFSLRNPELSRGLWERKKKHLEKAPEIIVTDCPGCLFQIKSHLQKEGNTRKILHTAELIDRTLEESFSPKKTSEVKIANQ